MQGKAKAALQLVALQSFLVALAVQGAWGRLASPKDQCWYDTVAAVAGTVFTRDDSACWAGEGGEDAEQESGQRKQVLSSVQTCQCWCQAERQAVGRPCLTDFTERQTEGGRERERERLMDAQLGPWNYALYRQVWFPFRELRPWKYWNWNFPWTLGPKKHIASLPSCWWGSVVLLWLAAGLTVTSGLQYARAMRTAVAKSLMHALLHKWNLSKLIKLCDVVCRWLSLLVQRVAKIELWQHTSLCIWTRGKPFWRHEVWLQSCSLACSESIWKWHN